MKPTISAVVITHNEEANIARCLKSIRAGLPKSLRLLETLVVDSQSKDRTAAIARRLGAKVFVRPWPGFSKQKNWAMAKCRGQWILSLDADEEMTPALWREIGARLEGTPGEVDGYFIRRRAFFLGKWIGHCGWWPDAQLRLIRRGRGKFNANPVHEGLEVRGETLEFGQPMNHYTYSSLSQYIQKMDAYSALAVTAMPAKKKRFWKYYLLIDPFVTFFRMYVSRRGFLDGWHGLVVCGLSAFHTFVKYSKLWEREILKRK